MYSTSSVLHCLAVWTVCIAGLTVWCLSISPLLLTHAYTPDVRWIMHKEIHSSHTLSGSHWVGGTYSGFKFQYPKNNTNPSNLYCVIWFIHWSTACVITPPSALAGWRAAALWPPCWWDGSPLRGRGRRSVPRASPSHWGGYSGQSGQRRKHAAW